MNQAPFDIAIIGAGIAGLAAARRARELALSCIVLEATDRVGGRMRSIPLANGEWWEAGATGLTQPAVNSLLAECERRGLELVRSWEPPGPIWIDGELIPEMMLDAANAVIDEADSLLRDLERENEDVAIADLLDPESPVRNLAGALLRCQTFANPAEISARDRFTHGTFEGMVNFSAPLNDLVTTLFEGIDVQFNAPVRVIDAGGDLVRLDIDGELVEARTALVTASTGVLASGSIQFVPELDARHRNAIESLPMTQVMSAVLVPSIPENIDARGSRQWFDDHHGPMNISLRPSNRNQITCIGALDRGGQDPGMFVPAVVAETTGISEFDLFEYVNWVDEEFVQGGWSVARPSADSQRQILAAPFLNKVWFAGEATSRTASGTMHGAMQSGIDAVTNIATTIGMLPRDAGIGDTDPIFRLPY